MKMIRSKLLILFFLPIFCFAQEEDFQSWSTITFKQKVSKKFDFYLRNTVRYRENSSIISKAFIDLKIKYKIKKNMSFALGYRDINSWNYMLIRQNTKRFYTDIVLRKKIDRYVFFVRNRLQRQGKLNNYNNVFRQRFKLAYNIKGTKLAPAVSTEYFYHLTHQLDKLRHSILLSYPLSKKIDFDLGYRFQHEINIARPKNLFILDAKLNYSF